MFWIVLTKGTEDTAQWSSANKICWIEWKRNGGFHVVSLDEHERSGRTLDEVSVIILNRGQGSKLQPPASLAKLITTTGVRLFAHLGRQEVPPDEGKWKALWLELADEMTGLAYLERIPTDARLDFGRTRNRTILNALAPKVKAAIDSDRNVSALDELLTNEWREAVRGTDKGNSLTQLRALFPVYLLLTHPMPKDSKEDLMAVLEVACDKLLPNSALMSAVVDLRQHLDDAGKAKKFIDEFKHLSKEATESIPGETSQS